MPLASYDWEREGGWERKKKASRQTDFFFPFLYTIHTQYITDLDLISSKLSSSASNSAYNSTLPPRPSFSYTYPASVCVRVFLLVHTSIIWADPKKALFFPPLALRQSRVELFFKSCLRSCTKVAACINCLPRCLSDSKLASSCMC